MSSIESKRFELPDETRTPTKTRIDIVHVGDTEVGQFTFEPGWKWSECIKPVAGTETCQNDHVGYVQSGTLAVSMGDDEITLAVGDAYRIPPGHDAWVVGDEAAVLLEFKSAKSYAAG
jgi:quercetin dioxygenase-like cupin family protein